MPKTLWNKETTNLKNAIPHWQNLTLWHHRHTQNRNFQSFYLQQGLSAGLDGGPRRDHIVDQ